MAKCLRCGAGNEWIEPIGKENLAFVRDDRERAVIEAAKAWVTFEDDDEGCMDACAALANAVAALLAAEAEREK